MLTRVRRHGYVHGPELAALTEGSAAVLLDVDYHPLNVMSDGRQVTGVLDWANVAVDQNGLARRV